MVARFGGMAGGIEQQAQSMMRLGPVGLGFEDGSQVRLLRQPADNFDGLP